MSKIAVRLLGEGDLDCADGILREAFGNLGTRRRDLRRALDLEPEGWFLALDRGEAAGMAGLVVYGSFAYLGFMAVDPARQRQGIGTALMEHCTSWLRAREVGMCLLDATEAGAPLYRRFGFMECDHACLFQELEHIPLPQAPPEVRPMEAQDLEQICGFDAPRFGADRSRLFRLLAREQPDRAFVTGDSGGRLRGYLFAQSRQIGPWVAEDPAAAAALLRAALALDYEEPPQVAVPGMNPAGMELLHEVGFRLMRSTRHMRWGGEGLPGRREEIYGQTSFALG